MISYVNIQRDRIERIQRDIDALKSTLSMMDAVLILSNQAGWLKYKEGLENMIRTRVDTILVADYDERGLEYLDRKKSELGAEIRLLKQILVAPDKFAEDAPRIRSAIQEKEVEIRNLERQVGRKETA